MVCTLYTAFLLSIWISSRKTYCWMITWCRKSPISVSPDSLVKNKHGWTHRMLLGHSKLTTNCDNLLFLRLKVNCILISPIILLKILMICSGYIAPEYLYRGEISTKSDIYSLGLLIMETTTGEKNCPGKEPSAVQFIKNVREILLHDLKTKL